MRIRDARMRFAGGDRQLLISPICQAVLWPEKEGDSAGVLLPRDKARATTRTRANCCHPVNVTEDSNTRGRVHRSIATSMRMCVSVWKQ